MSSSARQPHVLRHSKPTQEPPQEPFGRRGGKLRGGAAGRQQSLHSGRKLSAAELQITLLALLRREPRHGYELIKLLEELSDGFYVPSPGVIYPALTYLTEVGLTSVEATGAKKRYRLTETGEARYAENRETAERILSDLKRVGARMVHARRALEGHSPDAEATKEPFGENQEIDDGLEAVQRELRQARRERGEFLPEESRRIAEVLRHAADEIRHSLHLPPPPHPPHRAHPHYPSHPPHAARPPQPPQPPHMSLSEISRRGAAGELDMGAFVSPAQADFIYLLCRAIGATRVVESAAAVGMSALYLAAAVRDNGGGQIIACETESENIQIARRNLSEAGLADLVDLREGSARDTLRDLGGPVDLLLLSGASHRESGLNARQVLEIVAPQLRPEGIVLTANGEPGFLAYVRDPANGFCSMPLPFKEMTELSVKAN